MSITIKKVSENVYLGLLTITSLDDFTSYTSAEDLLEINDFHPKKKAEYLASRYLVESICTKMQIPFSGITKDSHGKPFLKNSKFHLSISHSTPVIGCLINLKEPCGLDIEKPREQLIKIKRKYLNTIELDYCGDDLDRLCLHWCAKEALYKLNGRNGLSFAQNLHIHEPFNERIKGEINLKDSNRKIILKYHLFGEHFVVYSI